MIILLIQAETILEKLSPLIYTVIGVSAFIIFIKGLFNNENIKTMISKFMLCATLAAMAYQPKGFLFLGNRILDFVSNFSSYFA